MSCPDCEGVGGHDCQPVGVLYAEHEITQAQATEIQLRWKIAQLNGRIDRLTAEVGKFAAAVESLMDKPR